MTGWDWATKPHLLFSGKIHTKGTRLSTKPKYLRRYKYHVRTRLTSRVTQASFHHAI
jgi:hypothetical protein